MRERRPLVGLRPKRAQPRRGLGRRLERVRLIGLVHRTRDRYAVLLIRLGRLRCGVHLRRRRLRRGRIRGVRRRRLRRGRLRGVRVRHRFSKVCAPAFPCFFGSHPAIGGALGRPGDFARAATLSTLHASRGRWDQPASKRCEVAADCAERHSQIRSRRAGYQGFINQAAVAAAQSTGGAPRARARRLRGSRDRRPFEKEIKVHLAHREHAADDEPVESERIAFERTRPCGTLDFTARRTRSGERGVKRGAKPSRHRRKRRARSCLPSSRRAIAPPRPIAARVRPASRSPGSWAASGRAAAVRATGGASRARARARRRGRRGRRRRRRRRRGATTARARLTPRRRRRLDRHARRSCAGRAVAAVVAAAGGRVVVVVVARGRAVVRRAVVVVASAGSGVARTAAAVMTMAITKRLR